MTLLHKEIDIANWTALRMRKMHFKIKEGKFMAGGKTPHQYLTAEIEQLLEAYTEDRVALAKQYMTPSRAQDYQNHLDGTLQNDPRLQLKSNRESV